jgi:hypothetical protein
MIICRRCGKTKSENEFSHWADGRLKRPCKTCSNEAARAWRKANPERAREIGRAWADANRDKLKEWCRIWRVSNSGKVKADNRAWRLANQEKIKASRAAHRVRAKMQKRKRQYGIDRDQYLMMEKVQNGLCKICGVRPKELYVDHDHVTKKVRGLLCHPCNIGIGMLKDDPRRIKNALNYLTSSEDYDHQSAVSDALRGAA